MRGRFGPTFFRLGRVREFRDRHSCRLWYLVHRNFSNDKGIPSIAEQIGAFLKESPVPTSKSERLLRFGGLAASIGLGAAGKLLKRVTGTQAQSGNFSVNSIWFSRENVERIVSTLTRMRGAALKLGQMISMQDNHIFPPEVEKIFARVRDGANFMPTWQMQSVLEGELGKGWREKFLDFEEIPFAAASIGQVHKATLNNDNATKVAVKIQYPGVAKSIKSDLENLKSLLLFSQLLPKGLFLENSIKVAQRELDWECDYKREALYMQTFQKLLPPNSGFTVPQVQQSISTGRVLGTDFMPGIPINNLENSTQELRDKIAHRIVWLCLKEIFVFRCMQTDPNWSNFLYDTMTDQIILLDFGSARDFDETFVRNYSKVIVAAAQMDRLAIIDWSRQLGFLTGEETTAMETAHVEAVLALGVPFSKQGLYDFSQASDQVTARVRNLIPTMVNHRLTPPPDQSYSLHRKLSGVFLLCTRLKARVDCHALLNSILMEMKTTIPNANTGVV